MGKSKFQNAIHFDSSSRAALLTMLFVFAFSFHIIAVNSREIPQTRTLANADSRNVSGYPDDYDDYGALDSYFFTEESLPDSNSSQNDSVGYISTEKLSRLVNSQPYRENASRRQDKLVGAP